MARRTLLATMGFDERHVLPALRLVPYDRLVIIGGRDAFRSAGFQRLREIEPSLGTVAVPPFDLVACLTGIRRVILENRRDGPVRVSVSGGTKILTSAAILAAFEEGVESWFCDANPVRLPVLRGVRLVEYFLPSEHAILRILHGPMWLEGLLRAAVHRGVSRRTALIAVRSLASKRLLDLEVREARAFVLPSPRFASLRAHLLQEPGKG